MVVEFVEMGKVVVFGCGCVLLVVWFSDAHVGFLVFLIIVW